MAAFGTDGVRELAGRGLLSPEGVVRLGRAFGRWAAARASGGPPRVALARDPRPSGPAILGGLARGLAAEGARCEDLGVLPTPALAWLVATGSYALGLVASASHNPAEWNGVKPFVEGGRKLTETEEKEIEAHLDRVPASGDGAPDPVGGAAARYAAAATEALAREGRLDGLTLVVDVAAGATSGTAPEVLRALGARVEVLHAAGSRPINDGCGTEHPRVWLRALRAAKADAGLAFDGDGDRVLLADRWGRVLTGDHAIAALARDLKERGLLPGAVVVGTVMTNLGLEEHLASLGVRLERTGVGDRLVADRMRALGAGLGGEPSGHLILPRDGALLGDGLVAGVKVLLAARRRGANLSTLRRAVRVWPQVLKGVRVREKPRLADVPSLAAVIAAEEAALGRDGRLVVRYSGTEPLLRVMAEGRERAAVQRAVERIVAEARRTLTASSSP